MREIALAALIVGGTMTLAVEIWAHRRRVIRQAGKASLPSA